MAAKIRRDDEVIVLAGKDKGKRGKVPKLFDQVASRILSGCKLIAGFRSRRSFGVKKVGAAGHLAVEAAFAKCCD